MLADDSIQRGVGSKQLVTGLPSVRQLTQEAEYPRAETAEQFARKNIVTDYRALVSYEFEHPDKCQTWLADLGGLLGTSGRLTLSGSRGNRQLNDAVWISIEPQRQLGVAADVLFHFRGGLFE